MWAIITSDDKDSFTPVTPPAEPALILTFTSGNDSSPHKWRRCEAPMKWQLSGCAGAPAGAIMDAPDETLDLSLRKCPGFLGYSIMPRPITEIETGLSACEEISTKRLDG